MQKNTPTAKRHGAVLAKDSTMNRSLLTNLLILMTDAATARI